MFSETLKRNFLNEAKRLTIDKFLDEVRKFNDLDDALVSLPDDYIEFYANNEKTLKKALRNMFESIESPGYIGWTPEENITKVIKYRGEVIHLQFDETSRQWVPVVAFRQVTEAVKYGKSLVDAYKDPQD